MRSHGAASRTRPSQRWVLCHDVGFRRIRRRRRESITTLSFCPRPACSGSRRIGDLLENRALGSRQTLAKSSSETERGSSRRILSPSQTITNQPIFFQLQSTCQQLRKNGRRTLSRSSGSSTGYRPNRGRRNPTPSCSSNPSTGWTF